MLKQPIVLVCAIALGVAIWLSPGRNHLEQAAGDQPPTPSRVGFALGQPAPTSTTGNEPNSTEGTDSKNQQASDWVTKENAPDWLIVVVTVGGFYFAWRQIRDAKEAVMLTERADVLPDRIGVSTAILSADTVIKIEFKNFGDTRAKDLQLAADLEFADRPQIADPAGNVHIPPIVLAPAASQFVTFHRLDTCMTKATCDEINAGKQQLKMIGTCRYFDVFGAEHHTRIEAIYMADRRMFQITKNEAD